MLAFETTLRESLVGESGESIGEPSGAVGFAIEQSVRRERLIVRRQNIACGRVTVLDKLDGIADSVADVADKLTIVRREGEADATRLAVCCGRFRARCARHHLDQPDCRYST